MNEKEVEKMRKQFFEKVENDEFVALCTECGSAFCGGSVDIDSVKIWQYMEGELKEAYYQGYMAGTMEAL